jgi:dTDP-4-dehydrorhamnose 3,5-epimerase
MMYIPAWCAHGFCVLTNHAEVVYLTSTEYSPDCEAGVMWNDPAVGIDWPVKNPILSDRDSMWPPLPVARTTSARRRDE